MINRRAVIKGLAAAAAAASSGGRVIPAAPPPLMNGFVVGDWIEVGFSVGDRVSIVGCEQAGHWLVTAIESTGDILLRSIDDPGTKGRLHDRR